MREIVAGGTGGTSKIVASRIPMLTEQMRTATLRAATAQDRVTAGTAAAREPARGLVEQLERLGYRVMLERAA